MSSQKFDMFMNRLSKVFKHSISSNNIYYTFLKISFEFYSVYDSRQAWTVTHDHRNAAIVIHDPRKAPIVIHNPQKAPIVIHDP